MYRRIDLADARGLAGAPKLGVWSPGATSGILLENIR
jgi:hypothetical protein